MISDKEADNILNTLNAILQRGNNAEVRRSGNGNIVIFEISKKKRYEVNK